MAISKQPTCVCRNFITMNKIYILTRHKFSSAKSLNQTSVRNRGRDNELCSYKLFFSEMVDLRGVEPRLPACHAGVIPLNYRPFIFLSSIIFSMIFLFLNFFNLFSANLASFRFSKFCVNTIRMGRINLSDFVLPELCSASLRLTSLVLPI